MYIQGRKWFIFLIPHSTIVSFLNQYPKWKFQYRPLLFLVLCIYHGTYIIDGNSELGKHVRGNTCYLICSRHSIRLRAVTNRFLSMRADHVLSYHFMCLQKYMYSCIYKSTMRRKQFIVCVGNYSDWCGKKNKVPPENKRLEDGNKKQFCREYIYMYVFVCHLLAIIVLGWGGQNRRKWTQNRVKSYRVCTIKLLFKIDIAVWYCLCNDKKLKFNSE